LAEKPQLAFETRLPETRLSEPTPGEKAIASPQVELPFAREPRRLPETQVVAGKTAKKPAGSALALPAEGSTKKAPLPVAKAQLSGTKKVSANAMARTAKTNVTTRQPAKESIAAKPPAKKLLASRAKKCVRKQPEFRQVLANRVRAAQKTIAAKKTKTPDRTRRITTRFSTAEERRIEKAASLAGVTVSAYLRKCALAAGNAQALPPQPPASAKKARKAGSRRTTEPEMRLFAQPPTSSLVGGWLTLLRQRFLSSPTRFSEEA
jgi:hypothetical protein